MIKIRDLKKDEWVKCENEEEVRVLWDWFNKHGYVRDSDDGLDYMINYFKDSDFTCLFCCNNMHDDFGWNYDYLRDGKTYINFKDLIIDSSTDVKSSILKINVKTNSESTSLSIRDLEDGQTFVMNDDEEEYLAIKASDIDGKPYVLSFDNFALYDDIDNYGVVRLVPCELNEV